MSSARHLVSPGVAAMIGSRFLLAPLGIWLSLFVSFGCAAQARRTAPDTPRQVGAANDGTPIMSAELDELTRAFADRYVGLLASTCAELKKDNVDPVQRREAQSLMTDCATNVYDIASNADAFTRMLDLVVATTLVSQVWIDDDRASQVFGSRDGVLVRALHHGRMEAWALAAQILRPDQLDLLDYLLWDWRRQNPDMIRAQFVRFSSFAIDRGRSANSEVLAAGGLLASVAQAGQAVDEARLLGERVFYLLKREGTLLRWQIETMKADDLATPEVGQILADLHRLTEQAEQLPKTVANERQAIFAALDDRMNRADATIASVTEGLREANGLVTSLESASAAVNELLETGDSLFARIDSWHRWAVLQRSHPFDIREYTAVVKESAVTAEKVNDLLKSSREWLGSPEWDRRIHRAHQSADGLMQGFFLRAYVGMGVLFAMMILFLVVAYLLKRRLFVLAGSGIVPNSRGGSEAGPDARSATGTHGPR